ncbi:hypothetical protein NFI96_024528 [Prochilodus magdalenae]|nr:hypothetical protein NFI96_024528 [Prochilodus magdalenae]
MESGETSVYGAALAGGSFDFMKFIKQPQTVLRLLSWRPDGSPPVLCRGWWHVSGGCGTSPGLVARLRGWWHVSGAGGTSPGLVARLRGWWHVSGAGGTSPGVVARLRGWWHVSGGCGTSPGLVARLRGWWHVSGAGGTSPGVVARLRGWWHVSGAGGTSPGVVARLRGWWHVSGAGGTSPGLVARLVYTTSDQLDEWGCLCTGQQFGRDAVRFTSMAPQLCMDNRAVGITPLLLWDWLVRLVFAIVVFATITAEGYVNTPVDPQTACVFNKNDGACHYSVGIGIIAFLACVAFLIADAYLPMMSNAQERKRVVTADLAFSGAWTFLWFVCFCLLANQWAKTSDTAGIATDAVHAIIAFSFFSIPSWGALTYLALMKFRQGVAEVTRNYAESPPDHASEYPTSYVPPDHTSSYPTSNYPSFPTGRPDIYQQPPFVPKQEQMEGSDYQPPTY